LQSTAMVSLFSFCLIVIAPLLSGPINGPN
jgi:hypothetical protein